MAEFVGDCPRCGSAKVTFDIKGDAVVNISGLTYHFNALSQCRACLQCTIFLLSNTVPSSSHSWDDGNLTRGMGSLFKLFSIDGHVSIANDAGIAPPDFVPDHIDRIFREGSSCLAIGCFNAAGSMFRLCLDMATKSLLPAADGDGGPNRAQRTRLFDRLGYLFEVGIIPRSLEPLATCVREDGNDAAHDGTLAKADAEDLLDFSRILLERIYTEPARLAEAQQRRAERRGA